MVPNGQALKNLQKEYDISVSKLCRLTRLSRAQIYRTFDDVETKDSTRILIYLAITRPDLFMQFRKENNENRNTKCF